MKTPNIRSVLTILSTHQQSENAAILLGLAFAYAYPLPPADVEPSTFFATNLAQYSKAALSALGERHVFSTIDALTVTRQSYIDRVRAVRFPIETGVAYAAEQTPQWTKALTELIVVAQTDYATR